MSDELLETREAFERRMAQEKGDRCTCGHMEFRHGENESFARSAMRYLKNKKAVVPKGPPKPCWHKNCHCITFKKSKGGEQ